MGRLDLLCEHSVVITVVGASPDVCCCSFMLTLTVLQACFASLLRIDLTMRVARGAQSGVVLCIVSCIAVQCCVLDCVWVQE